MNARQNDRNFWVFFSPRENSGKYPVQTEHGLKQSMPREDLTGLKRAPYFGRKDRNSSCQIDGEYPKSSVSNLA